MCGSEVACSAYSELEALIHSDMRHTKNSRLSHKSEDAPSHAEPILSGLSKMPKRRGRWHIDIIYDSFNYYGLGDERAASPSERSSVYISRHRLVALQSSYRAPLRTPSLGILWPELLESG